LLYSYRHLEKEDGEIEKETADFKVIEFNKEFKRVVASHTAIFREEEEKMKAALLTILIHLQTQLPLL
jgi:ribosomal protein S1